MKTFEDLEFKDHPNTIGKQAVLFFPNGYGVSVIRFKLSSGTYGSYKYNEQEWELAVLKGNDKAYSICYTTPITQDVLGHLSNREVTKIMKKIQLLPEEK